MNIYTMLVRREFWEHRSLWIAPLVWVGIILVLSAWLLLVVIPNEAIPAISDASTVDQIEGLGHAEKERIRIAIDESKERDDPNAVLSFSLLGISQLISAFTCIVVFFYLIDCLFTERRDRSILFWKSLPISDAQVVLSKYAVALVIVPLGVVVLAAATQLVLLSLVWMRFAGTAFSQLLSDWSFVSWLQALVVELAIMLCGILWYAPIAAYFLLLSVWARKLVFLWAIVPLVAIPALEGFFFHSTHVAKFIGERFGGFIPRMHINPQAFEVGPGGEAGLRVGEVFKALDVSGVFLSAEAWLGVMAAAAMVYLTIRIRRYRDDS